MKKIIYLFLGVSALLSSSLFAKEYGIRFISKPISQGSNAIWKEVEPVLVEKTYLVKSGKYYVATYDKVKTITEARKNLKMIKKLGYHSAYIRSRAFSSNNTTYTKDIKALPERAKKVFTNELHNKKKLNTYLNLVENSLSSNKAFQKKVLLKKKKQNKSLAKKHRIAKLSVSKIIAKLNKLYHSGNYLDTILYYEVLMEYKHGNEKIENNLCYLYGRFGLFEKAEKVIDNSIDPIKMIISYAHGATITKQKSFYKDISLYLPLDKSGNLLLLSGFYSETTGDMDTAISFYRQAYEMNPSNRKSIYALARVADFEDNKKDAKILYSQVLSAVDSNHFLYKPSYDRLLLLKDQK